MRGVHGPSVCPNCDSRDLRGRQSTRYYFAWTECADCDWHGALVSIPETDRAASDAALDQRRPAIRTP